MRFLLLCCAVLLVPGLSAAQSVPDPETVRVPLEHIGVVSLLYKPPVPGPWPILLFSHGRAPSATDRAKPHVPPRGLVRFWLSRGFAVVAPVRVGYGQTGGPNWEDSGMRWSDQGQPNGTPDFEGEANQAARSDLAVLDWLKTQPWADTHRIILLGQSVGGMTTIKLGSLNWPGVVALVNFAGGSGGNPNLSPGKSGHPEVLTELYRRYGALTKVPSLWLYAQNDLYWGPDVPGVWFQAFAEGGSPAQFIHTPPVPEHNGHFLLNYAESLWHEPLSAFVTKLGY